MLKLVGLGGGAGLVSALLFGVMTTGAPSGVILSYAAPLPILIVALGWHHLLGLLAAAIGAVAMSFAVRSSAGLAFAFGQALPAWWLAYLLLAGRPSTPAAAADRAERPAPAAGPAGLDWFPLGHFLLCIGLSGAFVALAVAVGLGRGDYDLFQTTLRRVAESLLRIEFDVGRRAPLPTIAGVQARTLVSVLVAITPSVFAAVFTVALALNVWLAAKIVAVSGRLARLPTPVSAIRMPTLALGALAAGIVLAMMPGYVGVAGRAVVGGVAMAFALQGLAFLHVVTRGRPGRGAILTLSYLLTIFFGATFLPLIALAGMIDSLTPIRRRLTLADDRPGPRRPS